MRIRKFISGLLYGVVVTALLALLLWNGAVYDYALDGGVAALGGGTSLIALFPPSENSDESGTSGDTADAPEILPPPLSGITAPEVPQPDPDTELDPEPPVPPDLLHQTVYRFMTGVGAGYYAAEFDTVLRTARFYAADAVGAEYVSLACTFSVYDQNALNVSAELDGETFTFRVNVGLRMVETDSVRLFDALKFSNPIAGEGLTLYAVVD